MAVVWITNCGFLYEAVVCPSRLPLSWLSTAGPDTGEHGGQVVQVRVLTQADGIEMGGQY